MEAPTATSTDTPTNTPTEEPHGNVRGHPWIGPRKHARQNPQPRPWIPGVLHYCFVITMELPLTVTFTLTHMCEIQAEEPPNDITRVKWLKMSKIVYHFRGLRSRWPRKAVRGHGNCCSWPSAKTAVAIAADFCGLPCLVRQWLPLTEPRHVP